MSARIESNTIEDNNQVLIIVMGWNYSTSLGVIRSLGMSGFLVDLYFIALAIGDSKITASSKYLRRVTEHIGRDDDKIISELETIYAKEKYRLIIIPTDDYTSSLIDRYHNRLSLLFKTPYVQGKGEGAITHLMDKSLQADIASSFGLRTISYNKIFLPENDEIQIPAGIDYPCFVKPLISLNGRKTEMRRVDNEQSLRLHLEQMRSRRCNRYILVQDFIEIEEEYSVSGLCLDDEVFLPALLKRLFVGKRERGVTIVGQLVPLEEMIPFLEELKLFLRHLRYCGLFCVDLVKCGDSVYFSEINLRSAGSLYGYVKAGANLPSVFVKYMMGIPWSESEVSVTYGKTFFYDKVGWEDLIYGYCTVKDFKHYLKSSDYTFMKDPDDPKPGTLVYRRMYWEFLKYRIKRLIPHYSRQLSRITKH